MTEHLTLIMQRHSFKRKLKLVKYDKTPVVTKEWAVKLAKIQAENEKLKLENAELKKTLVSLANINAIDKVCLQYFESQYAFAAADLIVNPDPMKVHGSFAGKGYDYLTEVMNVIAIKSKGRLKEIFLKSAIRPIEGGKPCNPIHLNSDASDFSGTLKAIQGRSTHLLRVNKSTAINLYYYELEGAKTLVLNLEKVPKVVDSFRSVKIDKFFDSAMFQRRKLEIQELSRYRK